MTAQAPEPAAGPGPGRAGQGSSPRPGKENVFTRKIGPLPMWVWVAIIAVGVLLYAMFKKKSATKQGTGKGKQGGRGFHGFGWGVTPPHIHHHHRRGDHQGTANDQALATTQEKFAQAMQPANSDGTATPAGVRVQHRGEPFPGRLEQFKASDTGATPSLQDVANRYNTTPDAIIQEAEGRGNPHGAMWTRYVARHDWGAPLPPATELSILAHPR